MSINTDNGRHTSTGTVGDGERLDDTARGESRWCATGSPSGGGGVLAAGTPLGLPRNDDAVIDWNCWIRVRTSEWCSYMSATRGTNLLTTPHVKARSSTLCKDGSLLGGEDEGGYKVAQSSAQGPESLQARRRNTRGCVCLEGHVSGVKGAATDVNRRQTVTTSMATRSLCGA